MLFDNIPGPPQRHHDKTVEPIFHPHLRRTKEVIRRPEWVRRSGEAVAHRGSLSMIALFGIMFSNCVGGGYGFEDGIGAAGPLVTLIVCATLPWIWCMPTGLAVAELSTAVPSNSGVLMWANAAFPPFLSFMCILATLFITFIGNATYPNLTAEYVTNITTLNTFGLIGVKTAVILLCCILNCLGVEIVGSSSIIVCAITSLPFCLLTVIQLFGHGFNRAILYTNFKSTNWSNFFSIISWNYANIENAGAVVEEVASPQRSFPTAIVLLMFSTYMAYVMPMLAGVSCMGVDQDYSLWQAGHWTDVAKVMAGPWLQYLLFVGSLISGIGFTLTSLCCTSRLLAGMGTMHMFPRRVSRLIGYYHPRLGTPIPAIVLNSFITMLFSVTMNFDSVVALCQSLYCLRLLVIYVAVIKLRVQYPNLLRPYSLPCNTWTAAACLTPAALFSIFASIVSAMSSMAIGICFACFIVFGSALSWLYCRIFAPNGFQGVIVQCEMSEADEPNATSAPRDQSNDSSRHSHSHSHNAHGHRAHLINDHAHSSRAGMTTTATAEMAAVGRKSVAVGTDDWYNTDDTPHLAPAHGSSRWLRRNGTEEETEREKEAEEAHARTDSVAVGSKMMTHNSNNTNPHHDESASRAGLPSHPITAAGAAVSSSGDAAMRTRSNSGGARVRLAAAADTAPTRAAVEDDDDGDDMDGTWGATSSARVAIAVESAPLWRRGQAGTEETLDEGVFYTDVEADGAGDILLGVLPLGEEEASAAADAAPCEPVARDERAIDRKRRKRRQRQDEEPAWERVAESESGAADGEAGRHRRASLGRTVAAHVSQHCDPLAWTLPPSTHAGMLHHRLSRADEEEEDDDEEFIMTYAHHAHPHEEDGVSHSYLDDGYGACVEADVDVEHAESEEEEVGEGGAVLHESEATATRSRHRHRRTTATPPMHAAGLRRRVRHSARVTTTGSGSVSTTPMLSATRHAHMRAPRAPVSTSPSVFASAAVALANSSSSTPPAVSRASLPRHAGGTSTALPRRGGGAVTTETTGPPGGGVCSEDHLDGDTTAP